jgi:hypothetical protein
MPSKKPCSRPRALSVAGPHAFRNLAVYVLSAPDRGPTLRTLAEGIERDAVRIRERAHAQVGSLEIVNDGDVDLFLHEGDRLQGGRQDRTVRTTVVVPAGVGERPLSTFCIERTRWGGGEVFQGTGGAGLAPKQVRVAAKVTGDQGKVWAEVAKTKADAQRVLGTSNRTSSLNEALDSPQVQKAAGYLVEELEGALAEHPRAVGVAFAVNGKLEEANVYPSRALLLQLYPRLLASYALDAVLALDGPAPQAPAKQAVERFLAQRRGGARSKVDVDDRNALSVARHKDRVECVSRFDDQVVHRQLLAV